MQSSSSSPFLTPPCSPQARAKRNLWFQQENDLAQSPPSVDRKTRICFSEEEGNCQTLSNRSEGQVVVKGRRLTFEQREAGFGGKISEPSQLRLHNMEGVEEIEEGWRTPQRRRIQAVEVCPPAPKKPVRRRPIGGGGGVLCLATATRKIDFEMAATVFSFNSRRRVLVVEEPESDSGHEGEPPNRRQRCSLHQGEGGWSTASSLCESRGLPGCAAESSSPEGSGDDS